MWMTRSRRVPLALDLVVAATFALSGLPVASVAGAAAQVPRIHQICRAGWAGFPYLNHAYGSDQGCTDNEVKGGILLTLGDTSGTQPVPAQLVLDTAHCGAAS